MSKSAANETAPEPPGPDPVPASQTFPASVYSDLSGVVLPYHWDVQGDTVTHWTDTHSYTGIFSDDGRTLTGGWRPIDGKGDVAYDAVMTCLD